MVGRTTIQRTLYLRWFLYLLRESPATRAPHYGNETQMPKCAEYIRLRSEVENVLGNLAQVTTLLLERFRSDDTQHYEHLDKELELTVGEKERAVGALRQHIKEHNCQKTE